jgi:hypothetical protein
MDQLVIREIESQLSMDADLLLRMLGAAQTLGATPSTSRDGKAILANAKRTLRERICADKAVHSAHRAAGNSRVLLVAAVVDCIAGAVTGVSPITVAVLLVKEGLGTMCKEVWEVAH